MYSFDDQDFLPQQWSGQNNTSHWELANLNERIRVCRSAQTMKRDFKKFHEIHLDTNQVNSLLRISMEFSNDQVWNKVN